MHQSTPNPESAAGSRPPLIAEAQSIAAQLEDRWLGHNHDHAIFSELAAAALESWSSPIRLPELVEGLAAAGVVAAGEALSDAEAVLPLAQTAHLSIDVTLWSTHPTLIEQMPHVGGLRVLSGDLLLCSYAFDPARRVCGALELGELTATGLQRLGAGDVVRLGGANAVRALFPISSVCVGVAIKARPTRVAPPRRLWEPGVALAPEHASPRLSALHNTLLALGRRDRTAMWDACRAALRTADLYDALWLLTKPRLLEWTLEDDRLDDVMLAVSHRHPHIAGALPTLLAHCQRYACARQLHPRLQQAEHRAVLALLTHRPGRRPVAQALRQVFEIDDAGATLSRAVAAIAEHADGVATRGLLQAGLVEDGGDGGRLIVNPKLAIEAESTGLSLSAPIKGRGLRRSWVAADDGWLFEALCSHGDPRRDHRLEVPAERIDDLIAIGVLIREDQVSNPAPFEVRGGEEPRRLAPSQGCVAPAPRTELRVAESVRLTDGAQTREGLVAWWSQQLGAPDLAAACDAPVWVEDPRGDFALPYHAGAGELDVLARLVPGRSPPTDLDPSWVRRFVEVGIVYDPEDRAQRRRAWRATLASHCAAFARDGYARVAGICPPVFLAALRGYLRSQIEHGMWELGDEQTARRFRRHNDPVAQLVHAQLHRVVETICGEPVKPSYCYSASYRPGARLPIHTDREQCEFSISLLVDFDPEPDGPSPWPLWLRDPGTGRDIRIDQALGDALVYRGRDFPHYRTVLPEPQVSTSMFLHYVPDDFEGALR